jgi:hypothetical protein
VLGCTLVVRRLASGTSIGVPDLHPFPQVAIGCKTRKFLRLGLLVGLGLSFSGRAAADPPGMDSYALPGVARIGVAGAETPRFSLASTIGYGWIESLGPVRGSHHRVMGSLAAAATPASWLNLGVRFDERYDVHPRDARGHDDSAVGDPRLFARASRRLGERFGIGAELVAWLPGDTAPSMDPGATTMDFRALGSWFHPSSGTVVAALAGYRLDQSSNAVRHPEWLRAGDRISLGLSEFDSVLLGVGLSQKLGQYEALGEFTGDWLVGSKSPRWNESPWRVTVGVRRRATRVISLELRADALLSGRPRVGPNDHLTPVESRLAVMAGVRFEFWGKPASSPPPPPATAPKPEATPVPPPVAPVPATTTLAGKITDTSGQGLENARVTLTVGGKTLEADTAADGSFTIGEVPVGDVELRVQALGYVTVKRRLSARQGAGVAVALEPALPAGQLRGLIRSFAGDPLSARVAVEPGGLAAQTDPEGRFELDLAPGSYRVVIEAEGFRPQKRTVRIENRGVTVINAELEAKR